MFIFRKINIGGVHLIEGFPNATRQTPVMELFTPCRFFDGSMCLSQETRRRMDVIKGIFVNFRPLKYLPTYL